jgi:hypothetical protein
MTLEKRVSELEKEVAALSARNKRVEADKAWERSYFRRVLLFAFTYLAIVVYMWSVALPNPWLNALIPSMAFVLSTLGLGWAKKKLT